MPSTEGGYPLREKFSREKRHHLSSSGGSLLEKRRGKIFLRQREKGKSGKKGQGDFEIPVILGGGGKVVSHRSHVVMKSGRWPPASFRPVVPRREALARGKKGPQSGGGRGKGKRREEGGSHFFFWKGGAHAGQGRDDSARKGGRNGEKLKKSKSWSIR